MKYTACEQTKIILSRIYFTRPFANFCRCKWYYRQICG